MLSWVIFWKLKSELYLAVKSSSSKAWLVAFWSFMIFYILLTSSSLCLRDSYSFSSSLFVSSRRFRISYSLILQLSNYLSFFASSFSHSFTNAYSLLFLTPISVSSCSLTLRTYAKFYCKREIYPIAFSRDISRFWILRTEEISETSLP